MTLVANTYNHGFPILIGDLLMSSIDSSQNAKIPSFRMGVNHLLDNGIRYYPHKLRQKIYIINDKIAVGLGGVEQQMKRFLEDIRIAFNSIDNSEDSINNYLDSYDFNEMKELSFIIVVARNLENEITMSYHGKGDLLNCNSKLFGNTFAFGSGAKSFLESTLTNRSFETPLSKSYENALVTNYTVISEFLAKERITLETIKEYWGAGFETIYFNEGKFRKVDDITFIIWSGNYESKTKKIDCLPFFFINQRYFDDLLLITVGDYNGGCDGILIPPIDRTVREEEVQKIPKQPYFDSDKKCSTFIIRYLTDRIVTPTMFINDNERPGKFKISFDEELKMQFMVDENHIDNFLKAVAKHIDKEIEGS